MKEMRKKTVSLCKQQTIWRITEYLVIGAYAQRAPAGAGAHQPTSGTSGLISTTVKELAAQAADSTAALCRAWPPAHSGIKGSNRQDMLGAIIGDIVGSPYEFHNIKRTDFPFLTKYCRFTDDTVMTLANAKWLTEDSSHSPAPLPGRKGISRKSMQRLLIRYSNLPFERCLTGSKKRSLNGH